MLSDAGRIKFTAVSGGMLIFNLIKDRGASGVADNLTCTFFLTQLSLAAESARQPCRVALNEKE